MVTPSRAVYNTSHDVIKKIEPEKNAENVIPKRENTVTISVEGSRKEQIFPHILCPMKEPNNSKYQYTKGWGDPPPPPPMASIHKRNIYREYLTMNIGKLGKR